MSFRNSFEGKQVLTIDDSRAIRLFLSDALENQGAAVTEAASGPAALERWSERGEFDLVLVDLNMPDMDGIEVVAHLRSRSERCTIVMITGGGGLASATEAMLKGADGYIEKQYLSSDDSAPFLGALVRAMEHRAGLVAQKQLQELKTEFYSMITHDLRNPAGNVFGVLRLLQSGKPGPLTPQQTQLLALAERSAHKLVDLINDYLDYAKIEAGYLRVERRETDLAAMVQDAVCSAETQAGVKRQTLAADLPEGPVQGWLDAERVEQVLDNLISNAIKYTPEEGRIQVQLRQEGDEAVIRVRDSGMGIPPDQIGSLFNPFHRVPGESSRRIRGTGLGLAIVREIVEAHGGSVGVESAGLPGEGSTFTVRLPLAHGGAEPVR